MYVFIYRQVLTLFREKTPLAKSFSTCKLINQRSCIFLKIKRRFFFLQKIISECKYIAYEMSDPK